MPYHPSQFPLRQSYSGCHLYKQYIFVCTYVFVCVFKSAFAHICLEDRGLSIFFFFFKQDLSLVFDLSSKLGWLASGLLLYPHPSTVCHPTLLFIYRFLRSNSGLHITKQVLQRLSHFPNPEA